MIHKLVIWACTFAIMATMIAAITLQWMHPREPVSQASPQIGRQNSN